MLKVTRYIRWRRDVSTISRAILKLNKYVFTKTWKVAVKASISENSGFHARKNPQQQYLEVVTFSDPSFSKGRIYVYEQGRIYVYGITHWTDRPVHGESFSIRQKWGLFEGVTHISNLRTQFVSNWCELVGEFSILVLRFDTWNIDFC